MANHIHPTAIIAPDVKMGDGNTVGPYAIISGSVVMGNGITVGPHAVIEGRTTIGDGCKIFASAVIGSPPQDKKFHEGDEVELIIGKDNVFREFVTANPGTIDGGRITKVGDGNLFMACSHIAHDCQIGNNCVLANYVGLSGHVTVEDRAVIGGLTGIHQFVRVGFMSITGGCSKVNQDVPPYSMVDGNPSTFRGLNVIGLKRSGMTSSTMTELKRVYKILFNEGLARTNALKQVREQFQGAEIDRIVAFVESSTRGLS